jgi:hypothetical protein
MVLRLYRWQESKGIADEIRYAKLIDKKVVNDEWEEI